jgi:uncharacterized protein (DUF2336 family)
MLRRVTDLFVLGSGNFSGEQVALFDDVMGRLVAQIEVSARAEFGELLAGLTDAPPAIVRQLALDDAIAVAGPILSRSKQLDETTLIEGAKTKSQDHLLAISRRLVLGEAVTDILLVRGDREVVRSTAGNHGAAFSDFGYSTLVERSLGDGELAARVWAHPRVPRQHLLKLFADASEAVKKELTRQEPRRAAMILDVVAQATNQIQTRTRESSAEYAAAQALVRSMHDAGSLDEAQLAAFAGAGKFEETVAAFALICDLPIDLIEHAFVSRRAEQMIVLAKAAGHSWDTTKSVLLLQASTRPISTRELEQHFETFLQLKADTAKKAIKFYLMRERAKKPRLN